MVSRFLFGLGLLSATALAQPCLSADGRSLQIFVSKDSQTLAVYDGTEVVATSRVSTGKAGHGTPSGIFSVIEKQKYHESNIYSAAPMPWMQRLTWSGIALHESNSVPRYPASHGCVRLPSAFAKELYKMTDTGVPVIISDGKAEPAPIEHQGLFRPAPAPAPSLLSDAGLRPGIGNGTQPVQLAMNDTAALTPFHQVRQSQPGPAVRILITRRTQRETVADIQRMLTKLGFSAGEPDGLLGSRTIEAVNLFKSLRPASFRKDKGLALEKVLQALYAAAGMGEPPAAAILVRQNYQPLFEAPIGLAQPDLPLGTHFLTVHSLDADSGRADWLATSLPNKLSPETRRRLGIRAGAEGDKPELAAVLDRLEIPDALRERIGALLTAGSSLTISDTGLGPETGQGTDFITLTRG